MSSMVIERVNISCFIYSNMPLDKCAVFTDFEREKILFDVCRVRLWRTRIDSLR